MKRNSEDSRRCHPKPVSKIISALKNWGFYPGSEKDKAEAVYYDSDKEDVKRQHRL